MKLLVLSLLFLLKPIQTSKLVYPEAIDILTDNYYEHILKEQSEMFKKVDCFEINCPIARSNYKPNTNGCGSYGIIIDFETSNFTKGFTDCCNTHDTCYAICNKKQSECDNEFLECLLGKCSLKENRLKCIGAAKVAFFSVYFFGCNAFQTTQKNSCICLNQSSHTNFNFKSVFLVLVLSWAIYLKNFLF